MTTNRFLQISKNDSHYTCSKSNCSQKYDVLSPYKGTVNALVCISVAILIMSSMLFLVGCSIDTRRQQGKFPNIPAVMDEYQNWDQKQFALNMNLSGMDAKDITQEANGDKVSMSLKETWKDVSDVVYIASVTNHDSAAVTYDVVEKLGELNRYNYGFDDAIELLAKCGISKNSIKVYDDTYSKGVDIDWKNSIVTMGSAYVMCGESTTKNGSSLFFYVDAIASYMWMVDQDIQTPGECIYLAFSKTAPFPLSSEMSFSSQSDEPIDDEVIYDDMIASLNRS